MLYTRIWHYIDHNAICVWSLNTFMSVGCLKIGWDCPINLTSTCLLWMGAIASSISLGGIQVTLNYYVPWAMDNLFGVGSYSENMSILLGWTTWKVLEQAGNPKPFVAFIILSITKNKHSHYQIRFPIAQGRLPPAASGVSGLQVRNAWWWGWGTVEPYIILIQ